jgi:hypothetical protein
LILPDDSKRTGSTDENGFVREGDIPPGKVVVEWNYEKIPLF